MSDNFISLLSQILFHSRNGYDNKNEELTYPLVRYYLVILSLLFLLTALSADHIRKTDLFFNYYISCFVILFLGAAFKFRVYRLYVWIFIIVAYIIVFFATTRLRFPVEKVGYFVCIFSAIFVFFTWSEDREDIFWLLAIGTFIFILANFSEIGLNTFSDTATISLNSISASRSNCIFISLVTVTNFLFSYVIRRKVSDQNHPPAYDTPLVDERSSLDVASPIVVDEYVDLSKLIEQGSSLFLFEFKNRYPVFSENIALKHKVTAGDFKFCALIFLEFSSKEIADSLNLSYRTVQSKKNKIRRKFSLNPHADLYNYMKDLDKVLIPQSGLSI